MASRVRTMTGKDTHIWIWIENGKILKAISSVEEGTLRIYDENDYLIMKRTGLNRYQVKEIEINLIIYGAKRLSKQAEPFKFL